MENEYQRVSNDGYISPREARCRVFSIIVLIINIIWQIVHIYILLKTAVARGNVMSPLAMVALHMFGIILLGNGLFGNRKQGRSIIFYVTIFELIPIIIYTLMLGSMLIGFPYFYDEIQKLIAEQKIDVNPVVAMIFIIFVFLLCDLYHIAAAYILKNYRKMRQERDREF